MEILDILYFLFVTYGIATMIATEKIFSGVIGKFKKNETVYYFLTCNKCLSVWFGVGLSAAGYGVNNILLDGVFAYTFAYILNVVLDLIENIVLDLLEK